MDHKINRYSNNIFKHMRPKLIYSDDLFFTTPRYVRYIIIQMQVAPFKFGEIQNLTNLGLDPKFFKFNVTHLESERYISLRDTDQNGVPQITIIELFNKFNIVRRPGAKIDGSLMHLKENIMALKAPMEGGEGHILQIYNMDKKQKLANIEFAENIVYWHWVADDILAVVTTTSVYHVSIATPEEKEVKVFERAGDLKEGQIIGYALSSDRKWSSLFAITSPDFGVTIEGHIQLYFLEGDRHQLLDGYAGTFGRVFLHNETHQSNVFCFVQRKAGDTKSTVQIIEISAPPEGKMKHKKNSEIVFDQSAQGDYPISLVVAEKYGLLYIVTKLGFLYLYEMITCEQIYKTRVSSQPIFFVARNLTNDGILALNKSGSLFEGHIDENSLIPHLINNCKHLPNIQQLASSLASRYNLPGAENFPGQFKMLYNFFK